MGSLAVLGIVGVLALGLPALDRSLSAKRAVAAHYPYVVGARVSVVPPTGAEVDVTKTRPGPDKGTALFVVDGVRLAVVVAPFSGSLQQAASRLRTKITSTAGYQVTDGQRAIRTTHGVAGVRGVYSAAGRSGAYAVFLARGLAVELTVSGPDAQLRALDGTIEQALRSVSFGGS
jgi:hypothetical protein